MSSFFVHEERRVDRLSLPVGRRRVVLLAGGGRGCWMRGCVRHTND